ncbi:MAG TPA: DUF4139 domain-containing protein [Bacteroidales bacterium]|nr:DUF4139 domain-containing protein [Bacteroidales bacterium]
MRKIVLILFVIPIMAFSQNIAKVNTTIDEAKVFLNGAQITRIGNLTLSKGDNKIVLTNLPNDLDPKTVTVKGQGDFIIQTVNTSINYLSNYENDPKYQVLKDSLKLLQNKLDQNNAYLLVYADEEAMIKANKAIGGTQNGTVVAELIKAADFFHNRLLEIKTKSLELAYQNRDLQLIINKIQNQLSEYENIAKRPVGEISINIYADKATTGKLNVTYFTNYASWIPSYDIRFTDLNKPITLLLKGQINQTTGENWQNTKIILSSSNPTISQQKPQLYPWYLSVYTPRSYAERGGKLQTAAEVMLMKDEELKEYSKSPAPTMMAMSSETPISMEYTLEARIDVPSSQEKLVNIQSYEMPAKYLYYTAPKVDPDAFLIANIYDWGKNYFLNGEANIYYENSFIGTTNISSYQVEDTMQISLGRDKSVIVNRDVIKDSTSKQIIGSKVKYNRAFEITVRNNKKSPIEIIIEDQLPISQQKEIEVTDITVGNGKIDPDTKIVTWRYTMQPNATIKTTIKFVVKSPKELNLAL